MNYDYPHRRLNPLTNEWVLVSPHRGRRPWLGQIEKGEAESLPQYDPNCYLCPGNQRAGGHQNPDYTSTFVFENDFAALLPEVPEKHSRAGSEASVLPTALFSASTETGVCQVMCFSPRHDLSLPQLSLEEVFRVVETWSEQTQILGERHDIRYVQVFENKGAMMGASNPHPHSQIWASSHIPDEPASEVLTQSDYMQQHGSCLLCDYLKAERESGERLVVENDLFSAVVPFWAVWPFEILLLSRQHTGSLMEFDEAGRRSLADILRRITARYDNLFQVSFPYSMGFHQAPFDGREYPFWHFHAHYYPPLLRSATVRKFMVGYEMLGMPQRDLTPESAAARLRELPDRHYRGGK
jgi:UDPglucose--hexose-1-phosphate uridylyltransferase